MFDLDSIAYAIGYTVMFGAGFGLAIMAVCWAGLEAAKRVSLNRSIWAEVMIQSALKRAAKNKEQNND